MQALEGLNKYNILDTCYHYRSPSTRSRNGSSSLTNLDRRKHLSAVFCRNLLFPSLSRDYGRVTASNEEATFHVPCIVSRLATFHYFLFVMYNSSSHYYLYWFFTGAEWWCCYGMAEWWDCSKSNSCSTGDELEHLIYTYTWLNTMFNTFVSSASCWLIGKWSWSVGDMPGQNQLFGWHREYDTLPQESDSSGIPCTHIQVIGGRSSSSSVSVSVVRGVS